jgi:hypothetical protein
MVALSTTTEMPAFVRRSSPINSLPSPSGSKVENRHVQGSVEHLSGLGERASLGHHLDVGFAPQQEGEGLAEGEVVLH